MSKKISLTDGKWKKEFNYDFDTRTFFTITSDRFIVRISGGSVSVSDKNGDREICRFKGYNYLYTGDIKPDESELFALENGKHFYVYSLKDFVQKLRVTLPRSYEAIDVYGKYSDDGRYLYIPVHKYEKGRYNIQLCTYETNAYSLLNMKSIPDEDEYSWPHMPL